MADDEDEDSVVAEVDVYLAQTLANNLYLFQYPVRPVDLTYDNVSHIGARVKPEQKKVEFDLAINTNSANYYTPRGEQIALDVGGSARLTASEGKNSFYTSDMMDKQVLTSSQASQDVSRYAVGVLKEGELHLSPIHGVLQLRPSFEYLNKGEENVRQASNVNDEGESQDEEEEAKPLTVKFARRETDRAKAQRLSSFKYLEQKKAEEEWKNVEFYNPQDDIAGAERGFLYCQEMDYESPEFRVEPREYLKLLTPSATEEERSQPQLPNNVLSMTQLRTMDLPDQVKALLINAKVITFQQLCTLLSPVAKEASVLRCVQQYGVLVQGCWVVKSELLYPEGSISPTSGVAADILCKGRDYLLWRFNQNRVVVRKDIKSITKLPNEDIKEMLEQVSRMRVALGWEFVLPNNLEFIQKHPDIYKQQLTMWEAKYQMLQKQLNLPKQEKTASESKKVAIADTTNSSDKKPSKSKSKTNHVMNHDTESSLPAPEEHAPMEVDCKEVASQDMSNEIKKEPLSPKSEHLFDVLKVLQDFVHEKLHRTVLSFADFKKLLLLRQTASTPGDPMCSGVPDVVLEKAILAAGATEVDFKWPTSALQNDLQSRRLFAFRSVGDSADQHRAVLLDMFRDNWFVTKRDFSSRATQETDSAPGKKVWATLQQDLLERVGNKYTHWYLRGTAAMLNSV